MSDYVGNDDFVGGATIRTENKYGEAMDTSISVAEGDQHGDTPWAPTMLMTVENVETKSSVTVRMNLSDFAYLAGHALRNAHRAVSNIVATKVVKYDETPPLRDAVCLLIETSDVADQMVRYADDVRLRTDDRRSRILAAYSAYTGKPAVWFDLTITERERWSRAVEALDHAAASTTDAAVPF